MAKECACPYGARQRDARAWPTCEVEDNFVARQISSSAKLYFMNTA
jgi:hypothetical protein